jgi:RNA-directed DNA polymerase
MNMALEGLEAVVRASVSMPKRARNNAKINVIRYADDFVVTGVSKEVLEINVLPAIRQFMIARGLELSQTKTRITHIAQGFDFLGQNVRKYGNKLLIKPAKKSVKALFDKVREIIKSNASATQEILIHKLNPVIRGWAMYHRHVVAKACYSSIDSRVWQLLWKWARRRHPSKGKRWVKKKYFRVNGFRSWDFATKEPAEGCISGLRLLRAMTIPIRRHVKVRGPANPFDPAWDTYFTHRRSTKHSVEVPGTTTWY